MEFDQLSNRAIGCAIEVHRHLGPGVLESAYEKCSAHNLSRNGVVFQLQKPLPAQYKDVRRHANYSCASLIAWRMRARASVERDLEESAAIGLARVVDRRNATLS